MLKSTGTGHAQSQSAVELYMEMVEKVDGLLSVEGPMERYSPTGEGTAGTDRLT